MSGLIDGVDGDGVVVLLLQGGGGEVGEIDAYEMIAVVVVGSGCYGCCGIFDEAARPYAGTASSRQVNPGAGGIDEGEVVGV